MSDLINPFEEFVAFGKAYPIAWPPQGAKVLTALVPTGKHVSHANDLSVTRNSSGGGGRATKLERYTRGRVKKGSPTQGLFMAAGQKGAMPLRNPAGTAPATSLRARLYNKRNKPFNSSIPTASKSGQRIG